MRDLIEAVNRQAPLGPSYVSKELNRRIRQLRADHTRYVKRSADVDAPVPNACRVLAAVCRGQMKLLQTWLNELEGR